MAKCPNKSHPDWRRLVDEVGEIEAYKYYIANGDEIPNYSQIENRRITKKEEQNFNLENKLRDVTTNIGIKVEAYDTLITKLGVDAAGAADIYNNIIYIANDEATINTLPEEVAHFFISGLGVDNPLVSRLMDNIKEHPLYKETQEEYKDIDYTIEKLQEETVGKLLGKYIVQEYKNTEGGTTIWKKFKGTLDLIIDKVLKLFRKLTHKELHDSIDSIYKGFADDILKGNITLNKTPIKNNILYQLNKNLKSEIEIIDSKLKIFKQRIAKYRAYTREYSDEAKEKREQFIEDTEVTIKEIETLKEINHEAAYAKLLDVITTGLQAIEGKIESGSYNKQSLVNSLDFISSYKDINLIKTNNEVIKKNADAIEGERIRIEAEILEVAKQDLGKTLIKESTSDRTIDELLIPMSDLSFDQRWLGAMANADDSLLALIDKVYKRDVIDKTLELGLAFEQEHDRLFKKLSKQEVNSLLEKYKNKNTGRLVSEYSAEYYINKKEFAESIKEAELKVDSEDTTTIATSKLKWIKWFRENHNPRENGEGKTLPLDKWKSSQYSTIQNNPNLKAYYDFIIKTKINADNLMGLSTYTGSSTKLPYFRADLIESIYRVGINDAFKGFGKNFKNSLDYTRDTGSIIRDESGKEVKFIKKEGVFPIPEEKRSYNIENITKAYFYSATMYRAKREVQGLIELALVYTKNREVPKVNWRGQIKDQNNDLVTLEGMSTNAYKRFEDWYTMTFIGENSKDQGAWKIFGKEIDKRKFANALGRYNSLTALALNLFSATSNIVYGGVQQVIEASGGEFYSVKDYLWATKIYASQALSPKMEKMLEYFRVLQDTSEYGKRKKVHPLLDPFILNQAGEHMMQSRIFLAMAKNTIVKDNKGKEYNLWESFDLVEGQVKLKDGIKIPTDIISTFRRKVEGVNQRLHGRYTALDEAALNQGAAGYLALQFRKWMHPGYEARFRTEYFDERLQQNVKGRYLSYGTYIKSIADLKSVAAGWNNMSNHDKANMRRNITELVYLTGMFLLLNAMRALAEDDDDLKDSKSFNFMMYQISRFQTEVKFYNVGIVTGDLTKLIRTPAAAISTLENMGRLTHDVMQYPFRDEEENMIRGEDYSKVQRDAERLIPYLKEVRRWKNVEDQNQYFKTF